MNYEGQLRIRLNVVITLISRQPTFKIPYTFISLPTRMGKNCFGLEVERSMYCKVIFSIKLKNAYKLQIRVLKVFQKQFRRGPDVTTCPLVPRAVFAVDVFEPQNCSTQTISYKEVYHTYYYKVVSVSKGLKFIKTYYRTGKLNYSTRLKFNNISQFILFD